jgi:hypothetical protein
MDQSAAHAREIELIAQIGRADLGAGPLTNMTAGGDGTVALSADARDKQRASMQKRWSDPGERARLSSLMSVAFAESPDRKDAMTRHADKVLKPTIAAKWKDPVWRAKEMDRRRAGFSEETKQKLSVALKRHFSDPAMRAKRVAAIRRVYDNPLKRIERGTISRRLWNDAQFRAATLEKQRNAGLRRRQILARCAELRLEILGEVPSGHAKLEVLEAFASRLAIIAGRLRSQSL